ncbi:hypothetical protein [Atribacter laminatus]|uniref:Uncharacterized protein n=1 Tax=Atribacter laminatus TaxID=2847778 RepID=A0A7T1ANB9_ATRLM|nr:hypothetical protein [Atribacter laminatus]QPM69093.1 hypothetical protein RT761_02321 [Atribacter laminatus]
MIKYREILRLHSQGVSQRGIAASCQKKSGGQVLILEFMNPEGQVLILEFMKNAVV